VIFFSDDSYEVNEERENDESSFYNLDQLTRLPGSLYLLHMNLSICKQQQLNFASVFVSFWLKPYLLSLTLPIC